MTTYQRVTRECTLEQLRPEVASAIHGHVQTHKLEDEVASSLICCETTSTKQTKRLFSRKVEVTITAVILTPKWLIWAGGKENEKVGVFSARLANLRVEDYEESKMYQMMPDSGLNVFGFQTGSELGSVFVGFGPEPAADKFRKILKEAMAQV